MIDILSGMPSIVLGVFGMLFIVIYLKPITGGLSLLSGALAMAILILPVIERSAEEAIGTVPRELEEGSIALGGKKWTTIRRITIPYALSGIMTGIILGLGRSAEESAIVVLTAGYSQFYPAVEVLQNSKMPFGAQLGPFQEPVGTLAISVYHMFQFPNIVPRANGFAAALVLILLVMVINLSARVILWRWKIG
jgi:phosphate transport system permease protein